MTELFPRVALILAAVTAGTAVVVTVNVVLDCPPATVTEEGRLAAVLLEASATTIPELPAFAESVTVPFELAPP